MADYTAQLHDELEKLRLDRDFMFMSLGNFTITKFTRMGIFHNQGWSSYSQIRSIYSNGGNEVALSVEEVVRLVDMRQFLLGIFWYHQRHITHKKDNPEKKVDSEALEKIGDDAFWLEFLRIGKVVNWHRKSLHRAILNSNSPHMSNLVKITSFFYLMHYSSRPYNRGTALPKEAFQPLEHIYFTKGQISRWDELPDFGLEPLFKNQVYRTNLAIDMSTPPISDWFTFALHKRRSYHVCHWLEHYSTKQLSMSLQDVMLYVVANYRGDGATKVIKSLEKLSPGICANFQDRHGNNLLWYTAPCKHLCRSCYYNFNYRTDVFRNSKVGRTWESLAKKYGGGQKGRNASNSQTLQCLFAMGISPDQSNHYGFTFRDLDDFGRMSGNRWQNTRLLEKMPTLDDYNYWRRIK